jgi:hypothetical protein
MLSTTSFERYYLPRDTSEMSLVNVSSLRYRVVVGMGEAETCRYLSVRSLEWIGNCGPYQG